MPSRQTNSCEHYPAKGVPGPRATPPSPSAALQAAAGSQSEEFKKLTKSEEFKKLIVGAAVHQTSPPHNSDNCASLTYAYFGQGRFSWSSGFCRPVLNGSNGSCTNTDDLDQIYRAERLRRAVTQEPPVLPEASGQYEGKDVGYRLDIRRFAQEVDNPASHLHSLPAEVHRVIASFVGDNAVYIYQPRYWLSKYHHLLCEEDYEFAYEVLPSFTIHAFPYPRSKTCPYMYRGYETRIVRRREKDRMTPERWRDKRMMALVEKLRAEQNQFLYRSQLNGNNGEWTNGDDMASVDLRSLEDARRRANTAQHRKKKSGEPKPDYTNLTPPMTLDQMIEIRQLDTSKLWDTESSASSTRSRKKKHTKAAPSEPAKEKKVENYLRRVYGECQQVTPTGDENGEIYEHRTSEIVHVTRLNVYVDKENWYNEPVWSVRRPGKYYVYSHGPGWAELPVGIVDIKRAREVYVRDAAEEYTVPAFYDGVRLHGKGTYLLLSGLVALVDKTLKPVDMAASAFKTITAKSMSYLQGIPTSHTDDMLMYYSQRVKYQLRSLETAVSGAVLESKNPFAVLNDIYHDESEDAEYAEPVRVASKECEIEEDYEVKRGIKINGIPLVSKPMSGDLFDETIRPPKLYRTQMFSIEGSRKFVQYDNSARNARLALKRIIGARENEEDYQEQQRRYGCAIARAMPNYDVDTVSSMGTWGVPQKYHERIAKRMKVVVDRCDPTVLEHIGLQYAGHKSWLYYNTWMSYLTNVQPILSREECAEIMHIKRALRRAYIRNAKNHTTDDLMVRRLKACVKNETAKAGKVPRLFVSYDAGCMYANELPEYIKVCLAEPVIHHENGQCFSIRTFAKPKMSKINIAFRQAIADQMVPNLHHIFIYSDDSVYMGNLPVNGVPTPYMFNVDISSCDSSNGPTIFGIVGRALSKFDRDRALGLIRMCKQPIDLIDPHTGVLKSITMDRPFEGSGTVLTTILNHFASISIAFAVSDIMSDLSRFDQPQAGRATEYIASVIQEGARRVGHKITCDNTHGVVEKLQFLKYSPLRSTDGEYYLVRNYGSILRNLGKVDGDLAAAQIGLTQSEFNSTNWTIRTDLYVSGVIQGYCHEPSSIIMDALRRRFNTPTTFKVETQHCLEDDLSYELSNVTICPESICRRYDTNLFQLRAFSQKLDSIVVGTVIVDDTATQFYSIDYGL